ncbi:MAG TPA: DinB family protein [Ohtaekwangia sp.]|uniref:DinB family protein n=1 Tax=Ohtaekwangia sp. TaxID=2066019 RepID=UPI002F933E1D
MHIQSFNKTIDIWIAELDHYNLDQLRTKPAPASWSLGQVYIHIIDDTHYYIDQIKACTPLQVHTNDDATDRARVMLLNNDFPNEMIEGSPNNDKVPQPVSIDQLRNGMLALRAEMNKVALEISKGALPGKAQHPGFNYLTANEWLQFAEMHIRHHLRQKKRIDLFLSSIKL